MIVSLGLRGLGVIDEADVDLGPGLTVITGETGAGKTMVVSGLGLLLGGRTDAGMVREGYAQASIEGRLSLPASSAGEADPAETVIEAGGALDEDSCVLIARTISAEGRSRAVLGGRTVPAATLADVGRSLVAVHGQDDQHRLLLPSQQRRALDRFAGAALSAELETYRSAYRELLDVRTAMSEIEHHSTARSRELAELNDLIAAIDAVAPRMGEEEALRVEAERLRHFDELAQAAATALARLLGDEDPRSAGGAAHDIADAMATLSRSASRDPALGEWAARLGAVESETRDVATEIARYLAEADADPGRLAWIEERRAALSGLRRRLATRQQDGTDLSSIRADLDRARADLADDHGRLAALREREGVLVADAQGAAARLRAMRVSAAGELAGAVTSELQALAMGSARLVVEVSRRAPARGDIALVVDGEESAADAHGIDEVEFLLIARDGAPARPLGKGASGGERSRIMLALEVVFAGVDPVPTFVFDEVDAGVGGKAAVEVGRRLRRLAKTAQVIVVTHLPQVAAFATTHLVVRPGRSTSSEVEEVTGADRTTEIARMLAGQESSSTARAHAEELLALVADEDAQPPAGRSRGRRRDR